MIITWTSVEGESVVFDNSLVGASYYVQEISGLGSPPADTVQQKSPFQDGATLANVQLGPRDLRMTIAVRATTQSDLESKLRGLNKMFAPVGSNRQQNIGVLAIQTAYGSTYNLNAFAVGIDPVSSVAPMIRFWAINFRAFDPVFYATAPTQVDFDVNVLGEAANDGDLSVLPYIDIYGPCNNPKVENLTTGQVISITGNVLAGYMLRLDHRFGEKTCKLYELSSGLTITDWFEYLDSGFIFWPITVDTNDFMLTSDDNQGYGSLYFYKQYLAIG